MKPPPPDGISGAVIFGVLFLFAGWFYEVFTNDKFNESPRKIALWIIILIGLIPIIGVLLIAVVLIFNSVFN